MLPFPHFHSHSNIEHKSPGLNLKTLSEWLGSVYMYDAITIVLHYIGMHYINFYRTKFQHYFAWIWIYDIISYLQESDTITDWSSFRDILTPNMMCVQIKHILLKQFSYSLNQFCYWSCRINRAAANDKLFSR